MNCRNCKQKPSWPFKRKHIEKRPSNCITLYTITYWFRFRFLVSFTSLGLPLTSFTVYRVDCENVMYVVVAAVFYILIDFRQMRTFNQIRYDTMLMMMMVCIQLSLFLFKWQILMLLLIFLFWWQLDKNRNTRYYCVYVFCVIYLIRWKFSLFSPHYCWICPRFFFLFVSSVFLV